ncbi:MAG: TonB family protein [Rhodocyclaceae bacterium]|nr:TonB family protein [Rhodocyclaceae bacterium]
MRLPAPISIAPSRQRLALAFALSLLLHALILSLRFRPPERPFQREQALDVILVNAKSREAPKQPQAKAQAHLEGGGNSEASRRAKTPLPASARERAGQDLLEAEKRVTELERQQRRLLEQLAAERAVAPGQAHAPTSEPKPSGRELAAQALALARLEGEIAREIDAYNQRPKRKFIGARTVEYRFAQYVEDWRQKVERIGNLNYPEAARGKLYGSLILTVAIRSDGSVERVELNRSSGHKVLDEAALRIVQLSQPFAPFPESIRREVDILEITRTWTFTQGDRMQSD